MRCIACKWLVVLPSWLDCDLACSLADGLAKLHLANAREPGPDAHVFEFVNLECCERG